MADADKSIPEPEMAPQEGTFISFLHAHFDRAFYLDMYRDVAQAGIDPVEHWLRYGYREGRQISMSTRVRLGKDAERSSDRNWKHYDWKGEALAVRLFPKIPPKVSSQILNQARHDPALPPDGDAIDRLIQLDREDVYLDVQGLQHAIAGKADVVLMVPSVGATDQPPLLAELVAALFRRGIQSIQTIVTDTESSEDAFAAASRLQGRVLFWRDFWIRGADGIKPLQLAQLVSALRPLNLLLTNSQCGWKMAARFGRALSHRMQIHAIYTPADESGDLTQQFAWQALAFVTSITDDATVAATLRKQTGDDQSHGVIYLPRESDAAFADAIANLLARS